MAIPEYFSKTYAEARRKFLEAARAGGAALDAHVHPSARGAEGEELAVDVARFGDAEAESLFVVVSGTHGNEGFCGSGCQTGLIGEGVVAARPKSVAVLLVHAVNPYGFSHIRRVTENNVDLNRNFQDFAKPLPENAGYAEIHEALVPADWDGPARAKAEDALAAWRAANGGMKAYQAAVAGGQYAFPDGTSTAGWGRRGRTRRSAPSSKATDARPSGSRRSMSIPGSGRGAMASRSQSFRPTTPAFSGRARGGATR